MDEIRESSKKSKFNNSTHHYITPDIRPKNFIEFRGASHIFKETKTGDNPIQTAEKEQIKLQSKLGEITLGNPRHKLQNQKDTIENIQNLYDSRRKVIDLFNNYSEIRSEAIYKAKQSKTNKETNGVELKILTPK